MSSSADEDGPIRRRSSRAVTTGSLRRKGLTGPLVRGVWRHPLTGAFPARQGVRRLKRSHVVGGGRPGPQRPPLGGEPQAASGAHDPGQERLPGEQHLLHPRGTCPSWPRAPGSCRPARTVGRLPIAIEGLTRYQTVPDRSPGLMPEQGAELGPWNGARDELKCFARNGTHGVAPTLEAQAHQERPCWRS